jgi:hypothetical protein
MTWTETDLREALDRFEQEHIDAKLLPNSVRSYVDYADRFLRWRTGDYRPRGASGPGPRRHLGAVTTEVLHADLVDYERDLRQGGLRVAAVRTYVDHASRFVRWLDGLFVTAGPRAAHRGSGSQSPPPAEDMSWTWEGAVQASVVAWLRHTGWIVGQQADTKSRQHGIDILASGALGRLAVEVKGYPQATYAKGERAGQPRRWHPASQARTYFGNALHTALVMRDSLPEAQVALAFPAVPGFVGLLEQVRDSIAELGIRVFLVMPDGSVREPYGLTVSLPSQGARARRRPHAS